MSNFKTVLPITSGVPGTAVRMYSASTSDSLGTITATGYLNDMGALVKANDIFYINYSDTSTQPPGENATLGIFYAAYSAPNMSLVAFANGPTSSECLFSGISGPDQSPNLVSFDVTVGYAALASAGSVNLITSSGSKQYRIRQLQLNGSGTNFSGGSGDRLGQVVAGSTVYSVIPAATMQSLANSQWGVTALPNPVSVAINTATAAGTSLVFKYSGGTTDYTAGSLVISGLAERVA